MIALVAVALLLLMIRLPPFEALKGVAGAWRWVGDRTLLDLPYFKRMAGTDDVRQSIHIILVWSVAYIALFAVPFSVGLLRPIRRPASILLSLVVFGALTVTGLLNWTRINWNDFIRPMPVVLLTAAICLVIAIRKRRVGTPLQLVLLVWSLAMLAKMPLNAHIYHYGFALAMPATVVGVAVLIGWLPNLIDRARGSGNLLRAATAAALVVAFYAHGRAMGRFWANKTETVGSGGDWFWADPRGLFVDRMVHEVRTNTPPGATLAVVPEGLIINYLARRANPTGQLNFTPPALIMYGEDEMLRAFTDHPPDYLILTSVDTAEYGPRFFGSDYARKLGAWMEANYVVVSRVGDRPFKGSGFGLVLMRRDGDLRQGDLREPGR
jgi:hypothetical protein